MKEGCMILMVAFHAWLQRKFNKQILKLTGLICLILFASFIPFVHAQEEPVLIILADYEWAHITLGDTPTESVRFDKIDTDIQIYFLAFNESSTVYDQFIISPNQTFTDPLRMLLFSWNGTLTTNNKLLLSVQSINRQPISVVTSKYEAASVIIGHPPMTFLKTVITPPAENQTQQIYDVLLDNEWLVSFDWAWTEFENQSLPQLRLYTVEGTLRDTRLITAEMKPLVDYGGIDGVGWIPQSLTIQYIKWLLYSGHEITVRPNVGFGTGKPLPSFSVDPSTPKVEPNWLITLTFTLPEGQTNFTCNLEGYQKYLNSPLPKPEYNTVKREYTWFFSFNTNAIGKAFTISVQTIKNGIIYTGETRIQVMQPAWQSLSWAIAAGAIILIVFGAIIWGILKTKRTKPTATEAVLTHLG